MESEKVSLKNIVRPLKSQEMRALYIALGIVAAVFIFVSFQYSVYFSILLVILFSIIVGQLLGKFIKLSRLSAEEKFKTEERDVIIKFLEDGVIIYDLNFKILTFNPTAEKIFAVSAEEVIEKQFDPGLAKTPHYRVLTQTLFPSLAPSIIQLSETDKWPQVIDLSFESPKLDLRITLHQVKDEAGRLTGFVKLVHDTTREKGLLQSKTDFISVAAHQLRTPLTALHWAIESIVKFSENNPEIKQIADEALTVSERALKITNDLLDISKIEEGKFGYSFQPISLTDFVLGVVKETKTLAAQYGITISFVPPSTQLPEVSIDQNRLSSVLFNLIDNAVRYNAKNGTVTISIDKETDGRFARVSVSDTGIGISKEDVKNLFQKLYRGSNAAQVEPNGSGLGLYIAKNIVRRHGGTMGVESELNRGSTFWFTVPLDPALIPTNEMQTGAF